MAQLFLTLQGIEKQSGKGVAGLDLGFDGKRDDAEFAGREARFLSPLRGFVVALHRPTACAVGFILSPLRGFLLFVRLDALLIRG